MNDLLIVALKGLAGGALVVSFALASEMLKPKRFAGLLSAAPAVAISGLAITLIAKGAGPARSGSIGMLVGSLGMLCYALAADRLLRSGSGFAAATLGLLAWVIPTASLAALIL